MINFEFYELMPDGRQRALLLQVLANAVGSSFLSAALCFSWLLRWLPALPAACSFPAFVRSPVWAQRAREVLCKALRYRASSPRWDPSPVAPDDDEPANDPEVQTIDSQSAPD